VKGSTLFFIGGKYSHCILKKPKDNDFRVQEEHGGILQSADPDPVILEMGKKTIDAIAESLLYARIDFVRTEMDNFALMELELIEPSLYFNMDEHSAQRFVQAFIERMSAL